MAVSADHQRNGDGWLGFIEDFFGVRFALALTENFVGEILCDATPRHMAPAVFVQPGNVVAKLDGHSGLESGLDGLFGLFNLRLKLLKPAAQAQEQNEFGLCDGL
jgi:hypothetical protein